MNKILLNILVWLEQKRNDLLWSLFNRFFTHDYDYLDLKDKYFKYREIAYNEKIHDCFDEQEELLRKAQYERSPVELEAKDYMAPYMKVLDLDSGEFIEKCSYANQSSGLYCYYVKNTNGKYIKKATYGNIVLVYTRND